MNEIKANELAAQAANALSSSPQLKSSSQDVGAIAKAVQAMPSSGKELPQEDKLSNAEVKSIEVKDAVSKLNEYVQKTQRNLDFSLDEDSGKTVIRVYDRDSEQLVRQIPDEVALELAKKLNTEEPALLFSAQVQISI